MERAQNTGAFNLFIKTFEGKLPYILDEPMSRHTTFKVGGTAKLFVNCDNAKQAIAALTFANMCDIPVLIIGNGSNILVSDSGFNGIVIKLAGNDLICEGEKITCSAAVKLPYLSRQAYKFGLSGLEFAEGIPGSVGGAVYMNAGAFGGSVGDVLYSALCYDSSSKISNNEKDIKKTLAYIENAELSDLCKTLTNEELNFSYRNSRVKEEGLCVIEASFILKPASPKNIERNMKDYSNRRRSTQPVDMPSAGSFFKRPKDNFAGALIENAGLKGYSVGGAKVSEKHAGFIVNTGNATANDVYTLANKVSDKVYELFDIRLEPEVELVGF
ncbi:MAG: UDP-N-acetylmuramate dehydrogenase [Christensenellaceae bacterium]|nr:UDP-N-acetylmuramate dehydrogenase [Christensenellaceae bacterium]